MHRLISRFTPLTLLTTLHVFNDGYMATMPMILPFISNEISLSLTQIGILGGAFRLLSIILALPISTVGKAIGHFKVLFIAMIFYAVGFILLSFTSSFMLILGAFLVAGVGFGSFHTLAFSAVASLATDTNRGRIMGNFTAWGDLGRTGITSLMTIVVVLIGWRSLSISYGIFAIVLLLLLVTFYLKIPTLRFKKHDTTPISIIMLLQSKKFILLIYTSILDSFASFSLYLFMPFLWVANGFPLNWLWIFTATFFLGNFMGKAVLGRLVDRFRGVNVFITAEVLMAMSIVLLLFAHTLPLFVMMSVILGAFTTGTAPVIQTIVADTVDSPDSYEKAYGFREVTSGIASSIAPVLLGYFSDTYGLPSAFIVCAIFALFALFPALLLRRQLVPVGQE